MLSWNWINPSPSQLRFYFKRVLLSFKCSLIISLKREFIMYHIAASLCQQLLQYACLKIVCI